MADTTGMLLDGTTAADRRIDGGRQVSRDTDMRRVSVTRSMDFKMLRVTPSFTSS